MMDFIIIRAGATGNKAGFYQTQADDVNRRVSLRRQKMYKLIL